MSKYIWYLIGVVVIIAAVWFFADSRGSSVSSSLVPANEVPVSSVKPEGAVTGRSDVESISGDRTTKEVAPTQTGKQPGVTPKREAGAYETKQECESATGKTCVIWTCDYVPAGKTFEEVCPNGGSYWAAQ
jgi:hypothetical protein